MHAVSGIHTCCGMYQGNTYGKATNLLCVHVEGYACLRVRVCVWGGVCTWHVCAHVEAQGDRWVFTSRIALRLTS